MFNVAKRVDAFNECIRILSNSPKLLGYLLLHESRWREVLLQLPVAVVPRSHSIGGLLRQFEVVAGATHLHLVLLQNVHASRFFALASELISNDFVARLQRAPVALLKEFEVLPVVESRAVNGVLWRKQVSDHWARTTSD